MARLRQLHLQEIINHFPNAPVLKAKESNPYLSIQAKARLHRPGREAGRAGKCAGAPQSLSMFD